MTSTNNPALFRCHKILHGPPLAILAELRRIEQVILQGIEELEGMLQ
jgi:type I restriction enzyme M protein